MPIASAQGSTVFFDGTPLGDLIGIRATGPSASAEDVTSFESAFVDGVVTKERDVVALEPGSCSVTFLGLPSTTAVGTKGELVVDIGGETVLSGEAYLAEYDVEATVGDLVRATATFQLTGTPGSS